MGLFDFSRKRTTDSEQEQRGLSIDAEMAFAAGSDSVYSSTPDEAMKLVAVYSCMYVLSSSLAQLPLHVLHRKNGNVEIDTTHPAHMLLSLEPNKWQTSYKWRETEEARRLAWGNAYTRIKRVNGVIIGLEPFEPWSTQLQYYFDKQGKKRYYYSGWDDERNETVTIQLEDMIHLKDFSLDKRMGMSRIRSHSTAIGWGLSMQDYGKSFFGSNGRPTGAISPKGELSADAFKFFKKQVAKGLGGSKTENRTAVLPAEVSYQAFTIPPEDMQFLQSRVFSWSEICALFNVPQHMTQNLDKATFNNTSELGVNYVKHTMLPIVRNWEDELNRKLFTTQERLNGYYVRFDLSGLLRGTAKERAEFYKAMIEMGVYDRNEVRLMENMNRRDNLDIMLVSQNVKTIDEMAASTELARAKVKVEESKVTDNE